VNYPFWQKYFHREAEKLRDLDDQMADDLHELARFILQIPHAFPARGKCGVCGGEASVVERLCHTSPDYRAGYRAIWRCDSCGEMEVR